MAGTLLDTITKRKFNFGPADPGGGRMILMSGLITLRNATADLTASADTVVGSPIITFAAAPTGFRVGDYVTLSAGFPSASVAYKIIAVGALTLTVNVNATAIASTITVSQTAVQVIDFSDDIPTLEEIFMHPNGGYIFDYDFTNKKLIVYVVNATPDAGDPLEAITNKALGALTIRYFALGY